MKKVFAYFCVAVIATVAFFIGKSCQNVGRYQILMHPIVRADQYLLDTKTGQVWHLVENQKDKLLIWEPMLKSNPSIEELTSSEEK